MKDKKPLVAICIIAMLMAIPYIIRVFCTTNITESERKEDKYDTHTYTHENIADLRSIPDGAIGIIEIDTLKISYPIYEGSEESQLSKGIGHMTDTAGLLEKGNCVLCGHNGSRRGMYFTTLSHIRRGDKVKITTKELRDRIYTVVSTKVVDPYDKNVAKKSDEEILTLFTCANHGTRRFVAVCKPEES